MKNRGNLKILITISSLFLVVAIGLFAKEKFSNRFSLKTQTAQKKIGCQSITNFPDKLACAAKKNQSQKKNETEFIYSVTLLPELPGGGECEATDINEANQVTGFCYNANKHLRAVVWENGQVKNLRVPKDELAWATSGMAINDAGNVAGRSQKRDEQVLHAMIYANNQMQVINTFSEEGHSEATGINNLNQVIGWGTYKIIDVEDIETGADEKMIIGHAFLWQDREIKDLGASDELASSQAYDINNRGEIAGYSQLKIEDKYPRRAALWEGQTSAMTILDNRTGTLEESQAAALNELDPPQIVGNMMVNVDGPHVSHAFVYENNAMVDLGTYAQCYFSYATDINNNGVIVGYSYGYPCSEKPQDYVPIIWVPTDSGRLMTDLNKLIDDKSWHLSLPTAINQAGSITGNGYYKEKKRAFLLIPK